ncbi:MAG TPA: TIGR03936 family radical SAM-associated protein [Candidatus Limnocylindrales bacterium]
MSEARQRWRLVFRRGEEARFLAHLDAVKLWERAFRRGRVPIAATEGFNPRPRLVFAAPLPLGMLGEHELADLVLSERLTLPDLRGRLRRDLPLGYELVELHDDWLGAPSLASQLVAADYRLLVAGASRAELRAAAEALLDADRIDRERRREAKAVAYDLRPLVLELDVLEPTGDGSALPGVDAPPVVVRTRLRHRQDEGIGRAEEVVAALAEALPAVEHAGSATGAVAMPAPIRPEPPGGRSVPADRLELLLAVRERLWLADELLA